MEVPSNCKDCMPPWPNPSPQVADELKLACYPQEKCPHFWEWMNRLYVLKAQLMTFNARSRSVYLLS